MKFSTLLLLVIFCSLVSSASVGPITGDTSVCVGRNITLYDTTIGGKWKSNDTAIVSIDSILGTVTGTAAGTAVITYMVGLDYVTRIITVNPNPAPIVGSILCAGGGGTISDPTSGGYWDITSHFTGSFSSFDSLLILSGLSAGPLDVFYVLPTGCSAFANLFVYPPPPPITGNTHTYVDSTTTLSDVRTGGIWYSSNTSIATVGSLTGVVTGIDTGAVTIYYYAPCATSTTVVVTIPSGESIQTLNRENEINYYPNPVGNKLNITATNAITSLFISNLFGQVVYSHGYNTKEVQIDVADLPVGFYFVKINGTEVRRFVKE